MMLVIFGALIFQSQIVRAQDLAEQFVQMMRYDQQLEEHHQRCVETAQKIPPESFLVAEPNKFYGIKPGSNCWPQVVEAYNQYYSKVCSRPTAEELLSTLAGAYRTHLSDLQLQRAIEFYSTDMGAALITAHKSAGTNLNQLISQAQVETVPKAVVELDHRLQSIAQATRPEK